MHLDSPVHPGGLADVLLVVRHLVLRPVQLDLHRRRVVQAGRAGRGCCLGRRRPAHRVQPVLLRAPLPRPPRRRLGRCQLQRISKFQPQIKPSILILIISCNYPPIATYNSHLADGLVPRRVVAVVVMVVVVLVGPPRRSRGFGPEHNSSTIRIHKM